jgi:hypothetical protein
VSNHLTLYDILIISYGRVRNRAQRLLKSLRPSFFLKRMKQVENVKQIFLKYIKENLTFAECSKFS